MDSRFSRTELVIGKEGMALLSSAAVAVFGIGGVGGYAVEALARCGVGRLDLYDNDRICPSNLNRQIHATVGSLGKYKADAAKERILDINPSAVVNAHRLFYLPDTSAQVDLSQYGYIIDAIDTVSGKIELAVRAFELGVPIISSMGAGNKLDATAFEVADIYATSVCPLARVMRRELRKRGIPELKVVYSKETPIRQGCVGASQGYIGDPQGYIGDPQGCDDSPGQEAGTSGAEDPPRPDSQRRQVPGSVSFVPPVAGMIIAGEVIKDLLNKGASV